MNTHDLVAFVAVVETGSIVAASARLNLTQPGVTRRIQNLEEMLGAPVPEGDLFYGRTRRRVAVAFDADLRALTERVAAEVRAMVAAGRTPAAVYEAKRCDACSLLTLCRPRPLGKRRSAAAWLGRQIGEPGL